MHIVNYDPKWSHKNCLFFPNFTQSLSTHTSTSKSNSNSENNLMLEKSRYSTMDLSKLNHEVWRNLQIQKKKTNIVWLWTENNFSLEKSPNSTFEFGEISELRKKTEKTLWIWIWRKLQAQKQNRKKVEFGVKTPNSTFEFGASSKLQKKICVLPQRVQLQNAFFPTKKR